jgi:two-component sensor histidine kinase
MIKQWLIYLMLLISVAGATAQNISKALLTQIESAKADTNRIKLEVEAGKLYLHKAGVFKTDIDTAFLWFNTALQLSNKLNNAKWRNEILQLKGANYIKAGNLSSAKICFKNVIDYYQDKDDKTAEAVTWSRLGDLVSADNKKDIPFKISCYGNAAALYRQTHDKISQITAQKSIAETHLSDNKIDTAETELLKVLNDYKAIGYKKLYYTYDLLGATSRAKADLHKELYYRMEAVKSMDATGDTETADYFYAKLALVYSDLSMYKQSVPWITKSLDILQTRKHYEDYYGDLSLLIYDLIQENKPAEAIVFLNKTMRDVPPINLAQKVDLYEAFGSCYVAMKQYTKAEKYYVAMMQTYKLTTFNKAFYTTNDQMVLDFVHYNETMGGFYVLTKHYDKAGYYFNKILLLPKDAVRPVTLSKIHKLQFQVDSASGKFIQAINHFEIHKNINDSLYNATKSKQVADLQIKYETAKKEQSIKLLQSQGKSQKAELQKLNLERNITFVGVGMLFIIAGLAYNGYRQKQRSNLELQTKQNEINQQNQSLQLLLNDKDELLNEKDWLLKEVHHRVKNNLQIVMSLLNTQSAYLKSNAAITAIRESQNRVQAISLIHQKLYSTSNVSSINMAVYIADLVSYLRSCYNTGDHDIRFELQVEPIRLDVAQAVPAGLILNEAINNAIKYAFPGGRGGKVKIVLNYTSGNLLRLSIIDNGLGLPENFDPKKSASLGMEMMKALSKQLGGNFNMKSDEGVCISIDFLAEKVLSGAHPNVVYN